MSCDLKDEQFILQLDLEDKINDKSLCNKDAEILVIEFIENIEKQSIIIQDDFKDLQWINVNEPLSLKQNFTGLITVCDFFTYCCINCIHILPFLHEIEEKYKDNEVVFIGIHSPKFENEKSFDNVVNAVIRHGIKHPVCNDVELKFWNQLNIRCWPTIVIIGPNGELLFTLMGELAIQNRLEFYIDICLKYFGRNEQLFMKNKLSLPISLVSNKHQKYLNYPTKIAVSNDETKIAIASTLSNRIIITNIDGIIEHTIGSSSGFQDGSFEDALFNYPQGLAWINRNVVCVCDTENNAIRKIDMISRSVKTIAKSLNSPWDLAYNSSDNRLFIAVAGAHQIWSLILSEQDDEQCSCFAGDGSEQKRNHRNLLKSSFAQPTGIASNSNIIYIADSESSSIRTIDLNTNSVSTLVGGSVDPTDLFAFGDVDGVGSKCKLQHCMGICCATDDVVYIADTFNHKIKRIVTKTKKCENLSVFWNDKFNEPNGLCYLRTKNLLLVADTNNHRIISIDLSSNNRANYFPIIPNHDYSGVIESRPNSYLNANTKTIVKSESLRISANRKNKISLCFKFENEMKATAEAQQRIKLFSEKIIIDPCEICTKHLSETEISLESSSSLKDKAELMIECNLNLCHSKENFCTILHVLIKQPIKIVNDNDSDESMKTIEIII